MAANRHWPALGALLGAAAVGAAGGVYHWLLQRPLPQTDGALPVFGLTSDVQVRRDRWGVPHISANGRADMFFAQGFVHAQDRLWQMEMQRRLASGRLAEILGRVALPVDRWVRILGLQRAAGADAEAALAASGDDLKAYLAGINAFLARGVFPIEFTLLRFEPEPWTVADLFGWPKMMGWQLSVNWQVELARARLIARLGPERMAELDDVADAPTILPEGFDFSGLDDVARRLLDASRPLLGPAADGGLGSNNWAVSGQRTASGSPLLASDMHLNMMLPAIWYENHLACRESSLNVTGVSFPGMPFVVAGHNGHVAWSFTNGFVDVQDLYMERLRRVGGRLEALYRGEWLPASVREETISVRGDRPTKVEIISTRHGPIINALVERYPAPDMHLALRWTGHLVQNPYRTLAGLNTAQDAEACHEALAAWVCPPQNAVYADKAGRIGYTLAGKVPLRAQGDGRVPVPGWTGEHGWIGYVPFEALPHRVDPPDGAIVTANNRVAPDSYPFNLGADFSTGARAQRIAGLLGDRQGLAVADMTAMQYDQVSTVARSLQPFWRQLRCADPALRDVVARLAAWDGELAAESAPAAVYQLFMRRLLAACLVEALEEWHEPVAGKGPTPQLAETTPLGARSWEWLARRLVAPGGHFLHNASARDRLARQALAEAVAWLRETQGPRAGDWSWGRLHTLTFRHMLGEVKPLDRLFNRGPFPLGGDQTTVWAAGVHYHDLDSGPVVGPPHRMVVDLADVERSVSMVTPGQSGQPGSTHYDDQVEAFFTGGYHPMLFGEAAVAAGTVATLRLEPTASEPLSNETGMV